MARRLFVGFVLCSIAALACWLFLPRLGIHAPWFVPLLAYVPMVIAILLMPAEEEDEEEEEEEL